MRTGRTAFAYMLLSLLLIGTAVPAYGHASAALPHARLSADGHRVAIEWTAAGDDVADIGVGLELLPEGAVLAYRGVGDDYPTDDAVTAFARSDRLRTYLLDNVEVLQNGQPCAPEVTVPDAIIPEGVRFDFTCPASVEIVDVRITLLHDRDPRYRTYSIDGTIWDALHTADRPQHQWDARRVPDAAGPSHRPLLLGGLVVAASVVAGVLVWWSPRRRHQGRAA